MADNEAALQRANDLQAERDETVAVSLTASQAKLKEAYRLLAETAGMVTPPRRPSRAREP